MTEADRSRFLNRFGTFCRMSSWHSVCCVKVKMEDFYYGIY